MSESAAGEPPARYIVVGADGSDTSILAMRWAVRYAHLVRARLIVVTAFDIPWSIYVVPTFDEGDYQRQAQALQDRTVSGGLGNDPTIEIERQVLQMKPAQALTLAARGAEALVVGSHGEGGFPGMHLGSVANYCVNHAPCPVVVYREPTM